MQSITTQPNPIHYNPTQSNPLQPNPIQSITTQPNPIHYNPIQSNPLQLKVSVRVIKDCLPTILPSITHIINSSLGNGTFPSVWKKAVVTPIPKEGDHEQANNNRPISLLQILSKVCERAALNQIMTYLVENDRLSTKQNGNKKWH